MVWGYPEEDCDYLISNEALNLPTDNTALREMIAKAGEVMRQRSMRVAWNIEPSVNGSIESGIRALPGVMLEDCQTFGA